VDWFRFTAVAGNTYVIETSNSLPFDLDDWTLSMDPSMSLFMSDDLVNAVDNSDDGFIDTWDSRIIYDCTESGTYYVMIEHYDHTYTTDGFTGSYKISVVIDNDMMNPFTLLTVPKNK